MNILLKNNRRNGKISNEYGQTTFGFVAVVFLIMVTMILAYYTVTQTNLTTSGHSKATNTAIEAADAAVNQMISDISNRQIDVLGGTMPISTTYPITTVSGTISVPTTIDYRYNGFAPTTDLEGNNRYVVDATVTIDAVGAKSKTQITRHVESDLSVINLARYNLFATASDIWAGTNFIIDGPFHCNGILRVGGSLYWNASKLPGGGNNPFWSDAYVTMASSTIGQYGASYTVYTMSSGATNARGYISTSGSYSIVTTTSRPLGTWFDKAHGGFAAELRPIPFTTYSSYAQVVIQRDYLPTFRIGGSSYTSSNLTIDAGITGQANIVKINLNALGTGTDEDVCQGLINYTDFLDDQYGLLIYVEGTAGIYGRIPEVAGIANTNKKIMIAATQNIEILGDILYSDDDYDTLGDPAYSATAPVTPTPAVSNPHNDSIALVCTGNIYINSGRKTNTAFYINSTGIKIDGFLYSSTGFIAQGSRSYKAGYSSTLGPITFFGGQTYKIAGVVTASPKVCFDPLLSQNVSKLIPVGIAINSWREVQ
ncbi:MAG: hypothetical protein AABY84_11605 [Candidatus Firestonebacteria bacterium]